MYTYIQLEDQNENKNYYAIRFNLVWINDLSEFYDPWASNFTANITEITNTGLVKIKFSTHLDTSPFNITKTEKYGFNITEVSESQRSL